MFLLGMIAIEGYPVGFWLLLDVEQVCPSLHEGHQGVQQVLHLSDQRKGNDAKLLATTQLAELGICGVVIISVFETSIQAVESKGTCNQVPQLLTEHPKFLATPCKPSFPSRATRRP